MVTLPIKVGSVCATATGKIENKGHSLEVAY